MFFLCRDKLPHASRPQANAAPNPKHKHAPVILGGMLPPPLALQIIVWFAGSVTNYWRMFVVLRPHSSGRGLASLPRNRGTVTPLTVSAFLWEDFFKPCGTQWQIIFRLSRAGLDHRLLLWASFRVFTRLQVATQHDSRYQQELLSRFFNTAPTLQKNSGRTDDLRFEKCIFV